MSNVKMNFDRVGYGRPILLVHGYGGSTKSWRLVVEDLSQIGEVTCVDLVGFGRTKPPKGFTYSLEEQARYLTQFVSQNFSEKPIVVCHSMGAAVVTIASLDYRLDVDHLVFVNGLLYPFKVPRVSSFLATLALAPGLGFLFSPERQVDFVLNRAFHNALSIPEQSREHYVRDFANQHHRRTLRRTGIQLAGLRSGKYILRYEEIEQQVHLIWGVEDALATFQQALHFSEKVNVKSLEKIVDCGHIPHEEKPNEFVEAFAKVFHTCID